MPQSYRYLHYDVFTDEPLSGNQLAVLPDARGLSAERMQAIAAEMAFSETTFVLPPGAPGADARMRIFTPRAELPMAGHPTVGSTFALAAEGVIAPGCEAFTFELGVGPTPLELEWSDDELDFVRMTQPLPEFQAAVDDPRPAAAALGLGPEDVAASGPAAEIVSCGVPMLFVPLAHRRAVDRATLDRARLCELLATLDSAELPVFLFALDEGGDSAYCRIFATTFGIAEDPATGGASGPLGSFLVHHGLLPSQPRVEIVNHQGVAMGRPSRIHIAIESAGDTITRVRVGGRAVRVAEGVLYL